MNMLAFSWLGIIGFVIILYVILDGFDLGIGILMAITPKESHRDLMISSIMPVWDGNETWLVFGGATLYGAFPLAFGILLPKLYLPLMFMLFGLLLRGVSFEFRLKSPQHKVWWTACFCLGSILATFMQGAVLGTFVHGFDLKVASSVPTKEWLSPFSITCGVALLFGYVLLAADWLIIKTSDELQRRCYRISQVALVIVAIFGVVISAWSPYIDPRVMARWFDPQWMPYFAILPIFSVLMFMLHSYAVLKRWEYVPFWLTVMIFLSCYIGFIISSWPYIVPRSVTYWQAAAPATSLKFMLVGTAIMLPILLFYTYHAYRVFRGKVKLQLGY